MTHVSLVKTFLLNLTVRKAERLKALGLFDVMALPIELKQLYDLRLNPNRFLQVVWNMIENIPSNMELNEFCDLVTDDETFSQLWEAFTEEVTNFSRAGIRPAIRAVFQMLETAEAERVADSTAMIQRSQSQLAANSAGDLSGELPELPELGLAISHSDNWTTWPTESVETNGIDTLDSAPSSPIAIGLSGNPLIAQTTSTLTETLPAN